jgi:rubrerythrin
MDRQTLLDKLSEFLMVEQGGLQLYTVAAARSTNPTLKQRYAEFGAETAHHRAVLVELIERLGGDPSYISPTARVAQFKAAKLLESSSCVAGLSQQELEANDLENVLLAETKDHADWSLLQQMAQQVGQAGGVAGAVEKVVHAVTGGSNDDIDPGPLQQALQAAVAEVESQEDEHLTWARETLSQVSLQLLTTGPAPSPERWQQVISAPEPSIEAVHPAPMRDTDGLLETAALPQWQDSPIVRAVRGT